VNLRLSLISILVLASACGHAAGTGGSVGGAPGSGPGPVQPGSPGAAPIRAASLDTGVAGSGPYARIGWWGGIPSCQGVAPAVGRHGSVIVVTLTSTNPAPPDKPCPEIAMLRSTTVALGPLPSGRYTVHAGGRRASLQVA